MSDSQEEKISLRFKKLRTTLGLNQSQFAQKAGIKQSQVSEIESGKRNITPAILIALEDAFSVTRRWMKRGEGPMFRKKIQLPGDKEGFWIEEQELPDGFEEPDREEIPRMTLEQKLVFALERNQEISVKAMKALEKNVELLEEISNLKDLLMERERELYHIKSPEKNGANDHIGTR